MRIYWLELKRVLKSRRAVTLLLIALVMSAAMAWFPVMFESINHPDDNGNIVELDGLEAIAYKKSIRSVHNGEVTPEKLKSALETYQNTVSQYGEVRIDSGDFPLDVYTEKISPIRPLLGKLPEAFADPKTGMGASLMDISPDELDRFYEQTGQHLKDIMRLEQKEHPAVQEHALLTYEKVQTENIINYV